MEIKESQKKQDNIGYLIITDLDTENEINIPINASLAFYDSVNGGNVALNASLVLDIINKGMEYEIEKGLKVGYSVEECNAILKNKF